MPFMPPVGSLQAVVAEVLDRFMQAPIAVRRAPVAIIPIIGLRAGCASKEQKPAECDCRQYSLAEHGLQQMLMQLHNILPRTPPRLLQGAASCSSNTLARKMLLPRLGRNDESIRQESPAQIQFLSIGPYLWSR